MCTVVDKNHSLCKYSGGFTRANISKAREFTGNIEFYVSIFCCDEVRSEKGFHSTFIHFSPVRVLFISVYLCLLRHQISNPYEILSLREDWCLNLSMFWAVCLLKAQNFTLIKQKLDNNWLNCEIRLKIKTKDAGCAINYFLPKFKNKITVKISSFLTRFGN